MFLDIPTGFLITADDFTTTSRFPDLLKI